MRRLALGSIWALALTVGETATAADLAQAPPLVAPLSWSWSGLYVGGNAGSGWGHKDWGHAQSVKETAPPTIITFNPSETVSFPVDGFLGGGQLGYRLQSGMWVWGVEGTIDWTDIQGRTAVGGNSIGESKAHWLATIAGQVGWTVDHALLFLKGGGAVMHENHTLAPVTQTTNGGSSADTCTSCDNSETRWGWLFGAGITYAFTNNWSAFVEYDYMDFGKRTVSFSGVLANGGPAFKDTGDIAQQIQVIRAGVNYKLDWLSPMVAKF
jgi:outer membrane immunogenic protein